MVGGLAGVPAWEGLFSRHKSEERRKCPTVSARTCPCQGEVPSSPILHQDMVQAGRPASLAIPVKYRIVPIMESCDIVMSLLPGGDAGGFQGASTGEQGQQSHQHRLLLWENLELTALHVVPPSWHSAQGCSPSGSTIITSLNSHLSPDLLRIKSA